MKLKIFLVMSIAMIFVIFFLNSSYSLSNQKGHLIKMKNGNALTIGLNKTAIIKNIWKDASFKDWSIKIKVLAIERENVKVQIDSPTFLGKDFSESKSIKIGGYILIRQAEEITTKITLNKISTDSATFFLEVRSAPPAPKLSESFNVEIKILKK